MSSWTWHLARSLFGLAGKSAAGQPEPPAELPQPERAPPPQSAPSDADAALFRACEALRMRQSQGAQHLEAIPDGAWRQFADAVAAGDGAMRDALDSVLATPAASAAGLRAKADALDVALDAAADDAELASRIARALIADARRVLPGAGGSARGLVEEPRHFT